jgi:hypothetical protein
MLIELKIDFSFCKPVSVLGELTLPNLINLFDCDITIVFR